MTVLTAAVPLRGLSGALALAVAVLMPAASRATPEAAAAAPGSNAGTNESAAGASATPSMDAVNTIFSKRMLEAPAMEEHGNKPIAPLALLSHPAASKAEFPKQLKEMQAQIMKKASDAIQNPRVRQAVSRAAQKAPQVFARAAQAVHAAVGPAVEFVAGKAKKSLSQAAENAAWQAVVDGKPSADLEKALPGKWEYSGVQEDGTFKYVSVGSKHGVLSKTTFKTRPNFQGWDSESFHLRPGAIEVDTKTEGEIPWGPGKEHKEGHVSSQTRVRLPHQPMLFVGDELHTARQDHGWNRLDGRNVVKAGRTVETQDVEFWTNKNGAFKGDVNGQFNSPGLEEPVRWSADMSKPPGKPLARMVKQLRGAKAANGANATVLEPVVQMVMQLMANKAAKAKALRGS